VALQLTAALGSGGCAAAFYWARLQLSLSVRLHPTFLLR
jgi:hypothetical protein